MRIAILPVARRNTLALTCLALVLASSTLISSPALADGVTVVDPQTGHRVRLPDNNRDGRADYVPKRLEVHVSPGLTYPRETREQRPSGGGSICHGSDGGSTVSTARRNCDPSAPAGDDGAQDAPGTATNSPSAPTRPSSSSSTKLN
ncbi:hypothetical protein [Salinicola halimionae]|uniref:hypothetical protein n=1 Tax=Salinicola halimionae TaxID=1949081 RepID=UPI000DA1E855|nr:hypothetical protein [Salinicola halimionae]